MNNGESAGQSRPAAKETAPRVRQFGSRRPRDAARVRPTAPQVIERLVGALQREPEAPSNQLAGDLQRALRRLSVEERLILRLRFVDDMSYAELADILGVGDAAARSAAARAFAALREALASSGAGSKA